jgi:hypothetical protein
MAGLLDYITNPVGQYGMGLLGGLGSIADFYRNMPAPQMDNSGPQYDAMGSFTGINNQPVAPQPASVFNTGAPAIMPTPTLPQPIQAPAPQPPMQQPQPPQNPIAVGNYQMPRIGNPDEFVPQQAMTPQNAMPAQGQMAQPDTELPPALGGVGATLGRLFNPDGLVARLTGNDSRSLAQQNLRAQYEALVPLVGRQKAMLAVLNPEAGKTILAQALDKKNYGFQKMDDGTIVRTDPLNGSVEVAYGGDTANKRGVAGPDGRIIPYPEGLDAAGRKIFANEIARINADAAGGKKTEVQAKSEKFANLMEVAEKNLKGIESEGLSLTGKALSNVPGGLGNYGQSAGFQKYTQAKNKFITSLLRDESGAAIGTQEFARYERELFPQPGDGPEVVAQKAENRKAAIEAMKKSAGPGYKPPEGAGPAVGSVQMGYRFKGGNPADRNSWERVQ